MAITIADSPQKSMLQEVKTRLESNEFVDYAGYYPFNLKEIQRMKNNQFKCIVLVEGADEERNSDTSGCYRNILNFNIWMYYYISVLSDVSAQNVQMEQMYLMQESIKNDILAGGIDLGNVGNCYEVQITGVEVGDNDFDNYNYDQTGVYPELIIRKLNFFAKWKEAITR